METTTRKAFNPDTEEEKDVEIPAASVVRQALLDFDYPATGIGFKDIADQFAEKFRLTDEQRNAMHKDGYFVWRQHVNVVANLLVKSGRLLKIERGVITNIDKLDLEPPASDSDSDKDSPLLQVVIESNYREFRKQLEAKLLQQIKDNSPEFFEQLVLDVLVALGYGSWTDAETVGGSGDGGIDGIIKQDKLGLDNVYVQAKRWDSNITPNLVREFAGALSVGQKGVFITTAGFSKQAKQEVEKTSDKKIVLIDGNQLVRLMIDHNVGVYTHETYDIKQVDFDYFAANDGE